MDKKLKKAIKILLWCVLRAIFNVWTISFVITIVLIKSTDYIKNTDLQMIYLAILWIAILFNIKQFLQHNNELRKEFEKEIDELK